MGKKGVFAMTLQQQAHRLIDAMGEEELRAWILLIGKRETAMQEETAPNHDDKWRAFLELEAWKKRNPFPENYDCEAARREAMEGKYGRLA